MLTMCRQRRSRLSSTMPPPTASTWKKRRRERLCACFNYGLTLRPFLPRLLDLAERWDVMARQGIDRQLLSVWADLFGYGMPAAAGARWHRLLNETLAEAVQQHPQRLGALASAPLQDAQQAARELEYGVKQCGAVGGVIAANVNDVSLGEVPLDEFWAAAVELDVPVFVHPTQPALPPRTQKYSMLQVVQYTYDTTASVGSLIFSGVLDRFPSLTVILSHGGGYFPYQVGRFDRVYHNLNAPDGQRSHHQPTCVASTTTPSCTSQRRLTTCVSWPAVTACCSARTIPSRSLNPTHCTCSQMPSSRPVDRPDWRTDYPPALPVGAPGHSLAGPYN